jgi:hypothetical protein
MAIEKVDDNTFSETTENKVITSIDYLFERKLILEKELEKINALIAEAKGLGIKTKAEIEAANPVEPIIEDQEGPV